MTKPFYKIELSIDPNLLSQPGFTQLKLKVVQDKREETVFIDVETANFEKLFQTALNRVVEEIERRLSVQQ